MMQAFVRSVLGLVSGVAETLTEGAKTHLRVNAKGALWTIQTDQAGNVAPAGINSFTNWTIGTGAVQAVTGAAGRLYGFEVTANKDNGGPSYLLAFDLASAADAPASGADLTAASPLAALKVPAGEPVRAEFDLGRPFALGLVFIASSSDATYTPLTGDDLAFVVEANIP